MQLEEIIKKAKNGMNKIVNSIWFVAIIGIILFAKTILFYNNTIAINEPLKMNTIVGTACFILVLCCFLGALPNRARIITSILISILICVLLFFDNVYYTFSSSFLSVAQITNLQYGEEIMSTLPMVVQLRQVLYILDFIIFALLIIFDIVKIQKKDKASRKIIILRLVTVIVGIVVFFIVCVRFVKSGTHHSYNKGWQVRISTIYGYHISDIQNTINAKKQAKYDNKNKLLVDYQELKEEYSNRYGIEMYPIKGIAKGKNIIIVQLESIQEFVVNKTINDKEITPNLNKFLNENIQFTNMNMQSYSTTADSEHSTITSIYPMENGMSFSRYYTNEYDDIFKIFHKANYHTSYMHGNYPYFWNRGNVYGRMQVDALELKEQFADLSENINGDLSDELLYRQAVQKLKQYDKPFFSYIVAASSHTPYILEGLQDRSKVSIDVGKYKDTYFGNYLEAANYADYAFGIFINELKKEGLYENTAILVFGDHNGLNMYNEELVDFLNYSDSNITDIDLKLNYTKVLCGLKVPEIEHIIIQKPVNKLDIKPTLAYLCDIEDGFSLGTNMFENKDFVCLNNEIIITNKYYFDQEWYEIDTGEKVDFNELEPEIRELLNRYYQNMKTELDISNSISVNNLLEED